MIDLNLSERRSTSKVFDGLSCVNVFILASGFEETMSPLCLKTPKSLINVMNKPLLAYQLEFLERNYFKDVSIITNKKYFQQIYDYISGQYIGAINADVISTNKEELGSLEIFHIIKNRISKSNFILLSGDSILNFDINAFIDSHILEKSLLSFILIKDDNKFTNQKLKFLNETIDISIYGIDQQNKNSLNNVVFHANKSFNGDDDLDEKKISLPIRLLNKTHDFDLVYNYDDVHFYIFNRSILGIVDDGTISKLTSLKDDLIPYLINNSCSKKLKNLVSEYSKDGPNLVSSVKVKCKVINEKEYVYRISNLTKLLNSIGEIQKNYEEVQDIFFQTRNNSKNIFMNYADLIQINIDNDRHYYDGIELIESITMDSYIADPVTKIGKKSRVNKSVTGSNLMLSDGSKITFCLLFDNVKIGKDCKISNSIIGENVKIEDNCIITDCVIQDNTFVDAKSDLSSLKIPA